MEEQAPVFTPSKPQASWWPAVVLATLIFLPLLVWSGSCVRTEYERGQESSSWPAATGQVLSSKWEEHTSCDSDGCYDDYDVHISYEYQVGEQRYTASRYRFGWPDVFYDKGDVKGIVAEYPAGADARVYYNPDDPALSTLRPGLARFGFTLSVVFLGVVLLVLWFGAYVGITEGLKAIGRRRPHGPHALSGEPGDEWEGPGRLGGDTAWPRYGLRE